MKANKRKFERFKRRMRCQIISDGRTNVGLVADSSAQGLFVWIPTTSSPPAGTEVQVVLMDTPEGDVRLFAEVARTKRIRPELAALMGKGGIALKVTSAPPAYYNLLKTLVRA